MAGDQLLSLGADLGTYLMPSADAAVTATRMEAISPLLNAASNKAPGMMAKAMPAVKMGMRAAPALGAAGMGLAAGDILLSDATFSNKAMDAAGMGAAI